MFRITCGLDHRKYGLFTCADSLVKRRLATLKISVTWKKPDYYELVPYSPRFPFDV
jgi:hypothetical protein